MSIFLINIKIVSKNETKVIENFLAIKLQTENQHLQAIFDFVLVKLCFPKTAE